MATPRIFQQLQQDDQFLGNVLHDLYGVVTPDNWPNPFIHTTQASDPKTGAEAPPPIPPQTPATTPATSGKGTWWIVGGGVALALLVGAWMWRRAR